MKSMLSLVKHGSSAIIGRLLAGVRMAVLGGARAVRWVGTLPAKRRCNAGWNMRKSVADTAACAAIVVSMDKASGIKEAARVKAEAVNPKKRGSQIYYIGFDRFEVLNNRNSAALFFALAEAGVDELRVEAVAAAFGAPCAVGALEMRLHVLTQALSKHEDYDTVLRRGARRKEVAEAESEDDDANVPRCYLGCGENVALDMSAKLAERIGSAWVASWAATWREADGADVNRRLARLANRLVDYVETTPIRGGTERVAALISALGPREIEALLQACNRAPGDSALSRIKSTLMTLHERGELGGVAHEVRGARSVSRI